MVYFDITLGGVSLPSGSAAYLTVYEDVGADGSGSNTDPNGKAYDNSDTVPLQDATTSYSTADTFDGSSGNEVWIRVREETDSVTSTPTVTGTIDLTAQATSQTVSATATTVNVSTPSPSVSPFIAGTVTLNGSGFEGAKVYVINDTDGALLGSTTTDASGDYSIEVPSGHVFHVAVQYEDAEGNQYNAESKPFVTT